MKSGYYLHLYKKSGWILTPGNYRLIAKAYYDDAWHDLKSMNFTVVKNYSCSDSTTKNSAYYLDKFYKEYKDTFGDKSGSTYTCYTDYLCQDFNSYFKIAVHKSTYDLYWYYDKWYYYGKGSNLYK